MNKVILLVDDSTDDIFVLQRSLEAAGVANPMRVVHSGEEALAYLKGEGRYRNRQEYPFPDVLFLDLAMPGKDGWEVLKWLHTQPFLNENLVIFVLTGAVGTNRLQEAYSLGAQSFLLKPLEPLEIQGLIRFWPTVWILTKGLTTPAHSQGGNQLSRR
jgi:CheY-like chemotaxis protein